MTVDPNHFNVERSDLERAAASGTRVWDMRRLPRQASRCLWHEADTIPELVTASVGAGLQTRRDGDGIVVADRDGNHLGEIPAHRLLAPDWVHVLDKLTDLIESADTDLQRETLTAAMGTIRHEPWEVIDRPCWDVVIIPIGERSGILLTRPFVVPEWPSDDDLPVDGMYVADVWDLPEGLGADGYR